MTTVESGPSMTRRSTSISIPSSSIPVPTTASRNNPLSLRIYKAIGTTFDDPSSREALEIASQLYAGKGKAKAKASVNGFEAGEDEDDWGLQRRAAKGESAAMARKYLKKDVENKMASGSLKFLEIFGEVDKKLNVLREHMEDMQIRCDQVQAELDQANSGTKYLLERADGLRTQRTSELMDVSSRAEAQLKLDLVNLFLARFTLTEDEQKALTSWDVGLSQAVFDALDHVIAIRRDCQALLSGEEGKMQAGLDIMALTSEQMESGYKKIHRRCQFEFRQFTKEGHVEVSPVLREAIRRLRQRPALLDDALSNLTSTRQSSLLNSFLEALTRGGPNGLPRPIELHAHDPIRYVGDMLAWVHQATASEHEFLESLFGVRERKRMMGSERLKDAELDVEEAMVRDALDKDLDGLSRPLKMRIQQTVKSQEGIIMTYKVTNLLQFYLVTMRKTIGDDAGLCKTLQQIYEQSNAAFFETLDAQGRSLLRFLHPPDATLTPPVALRDSCQILRELIAVYETSLVDPADRPNDSDFSTLLEKAVDPAIEMCERVADLRKGATSWDKDIFLINCLGYLEHTLESYPFTKEKVDMLETRIQQHVESMTFEHHGNLLEQSGLAPIMKTIRNRPADTPLSRLPATSPKLLTQALTTFSTFLTQIDVLTSPRLALLGSAFLAEQIHHTALSKISEAYGELCDRVLDKKEGYEFAETLLRRGKEEVAVALGVDVGA
ncbi:putative intra-golgi transport-related protein [Kockovaella imperatae]|uniref:Conserved oligomeric Golgi complex subunit 6 n=1 Tax=Kockovaella imperatae TaxID=4999 RepID=A0A1Y1UB95_9TREE|nr:putative intra-golgi transport-related protein [Kockovaella imperatae]ORX35318.1 putative intra-golgi transport-related protein [Kockovaella imperatae]